MFERFTEKSRRVVFFARYEASQYGSSAIAIEHLLLALLREDRALFTLSTGNNIASGMRPEIEKHIVRGTPPRNLEVPLSPECRRVFDLAQESSEALRHLKIDTGHMLVGILRMDSSTAAQILFAQGVRLESLLEKLAKAPIHTVPTTSRMSGLLTVDCFLIGLKNLKSDDLISFFATNAEFIDASGNAWNRVELENDFEKLFAPYATKNATYLIEPALTETGELFVCNILWRHVVTERAESMQRMSAVMVFEDGWKVLLLQATSIVNNS